MSEDSCQGNLPSDSVSFCLTGCDVDDVTGCDHYTCAPLAVNGALADQAFN